MKRLNQQGSIHLLLVIIIVIAVIAGVLLVKQRSSILPKATTPSTTYKMETHTTQTINNQADLEDNLNELENTPIDQIDQELDQNTSDASTF